MPAARQRKQVRSWRKLASESQELHHLLDYLYLSQTLEEIHDPIDREALLDAVAHGSTAAWRHFDLLGEYDLSEEQFRDSMARGSQN